MKNIQVKEYVNYNEGEILSLYRSVGWVNYYKNPAMLEKSYQHSLYVLGAYSGGDLVGIIRVVGDGYSIIYIQDIIVLPAYQRKGIGRTLINTVLDRYKDVYQTVLLTEDQPNTVKFYESMGLTQVAKQGCVSFVRYR